MTAFLFYLLIYLFFRPSLSRPRLLLFFPTFLTAGCVLMQEDKTPPSPLSPPSVLRVGFPQSDKGPLVLMRHCYPRSCQTRTYYRHSSVTERPEHFDRPTASDLGTGARFFVVYFFAFLHNLVLNFLCSWTPDKKCSILTRKCQYNTFQCFSITIMQRCFLP